MQKFIPDQLTFNFAHLPQIWWLTTSCAIVMDLHGHCGHRLRIIIVPVDSLTQVGVFRWGCHRPQLRCQLQSLVFFRMLNWWNYHGLVLSSSSLRGLSSEILNHVFWIRCIAPLRSVEPWLERWGCLSATHRRFKSSSLFFSIDFPCYEFPRRCFTIILAGCHELPEILSIWIRFQFFQQFI